MAELIRVNMCATVPGLGAASKIAAPPFRSQPAVQAFARVLTSAATASAVAADSVQPRCPWPVL